MSSLIACNHDEQISEPVEIELETKEKELPVSKSPKVEVADTSLFSFRDPETELYGYINKQGVVVIKPQIGQTFDFSVDLGKVSRWVDGVTKSGFVNDSGDFVIEPEYDRAENFLNGLAAVSVFRGTYKNGFINKQSEMVTEIDGPFSAVDNLPDFSGIQKFCD
ncbi:WG repeat-containing protein [Alkalihalobacillus deserti]|uniref:WG repeat-containing protein n=1 Tax=Alkalihalobacillus deserti TaxID=2879466 RepID=UPI001D1359E5|nr:WG repeat-containing protein [Alkalihalobacillus deserti]